MKLHALMIAVALAAGSAFAVAANDTSAATSGTTAGASASTTMDSGSAKTMKPARKHHRKVHASRRHHERVAQRREERHERMAERRHERHENMAMNGRHTRSMGAGAATPSVDLNSTARERRMDSAYNDWLRTSRR